MGPNSFRNLTYAAVLLVVGALVYLIYQSSKKKKLNSLSNIENTNSGISGFTDTLGSISGPSIASLPGDSVTSSVDGQYVSGSTKQPSAYADRSTQPVRESASEIKEITATEPSTEIASSEKKAPKAPKAPTVNSKGLSAPAKKFDAGNTGAGEFLVIAGSFASTDNAMALVGKLKKMGYTHAEAVKLENSANTHVIAGYYDFKGGADAAVRALKANKIEAFTKKKSGEIYKAAPTVTPKSPVKTTKPAVTTKPI